MEDFKAKVMTQLEVLNEAVKGEYSMTMWRRVSELLAAVLQVMNMWNVWYAKYKGGK